MLSNRKNKIYTTMLSVKPYDMFEYNYDKAHASGERFYQAVSLLAEGDFLGFQIFAEKEKDCWVSVFSKPEAAVTREDYVWIFKDCAGVDKGSLELPDSFFLEDRKVYMLIPRQKGGKNDGHSRASKRKKSRSKYFTELLEIMCDVGAAIRLVIEPVCGNDEGQGMILFSLSHELPLRLQAVIAMAFPDTEVKNIDDVAQFDSFCDSSMLIAGVSELLNALMMLKENRAEDDELAERDEEGACITADHEDEDDPSATTPIEELDLSVRSYNCLKRAGIKTVEKLRALTDEDYCHIRNLGKKSIDEIKQRLTAYVEISAPAPLTAPCYADMLEELIGLKNAKDQMHKITAFAKLKKAMTESGKEQIPMVMNMEFVGNPGTAKTTVARIFAGMLHEIGLLSGNELIEVGRADLVAKYVGQTADKVKEIFRRARGKLLFIDEAYSLVENWEGSYGDEAISTIVQEMENNRENTVVIFAGYPDKMEELFARNPGLRSRVPFTVRFDDYSGEELLQITEREARIHGFALTDQAREKAAALCAMAAGRQELGNGRFCRNLAESAVLSYAARVYGSENSANSDFTLCDEDFSVPTALQECKERRPIGFLS